MGARLRWRELEDVYAGSNKWSELCQDAGIPTLPAGAGRQLRRFFLTPFEAANVGTILIAVSGSFHGDEVVEADDRKR